MCTKLSNSPCNHGLAAAAEAAADLVTKVRLPTRRFEAELRYNPPRRCVRPQPACLRLFVVAFVVRNDDRSAPRKPLVAILAPAATGKSALALAVAERFDGEIINCDSTAVYRGFDIGTDKIALADRRGIEHHLIDIADPTEDYTAARFAHDAA